MTIYYSGERDEYTPPWARPFEEAFKKPEPMPHSEPLPPSFWDEPSRKRMMGSISGMGQRVQRLKLVGDEPVHDVVTRGPTIDTIGL